MYLLAGIPAYFVTVAVRRVPGTASRAGALAGGLSPRVAPKGSINWGRGFLRFWMVAAALWVVVVVLFGWTTVVSPYVPAKVVATPVATGVATLFSTYGEPYQSFSSMARSGQLVDTQVRPGYSLYTPLDLTGQPLQARLTEARALVDHYIRTETVTRRSQALPGLIMAALVPPLVLLVLGWAIRWAVAVFRRVD